MGAAMKCALIKGSGTPERMHESSMVFISKSSRTGTTLMSLQ